MSVLQLRRDMVVVEEEKAVEIDKPFPLRTIEAEVTDVTDIEEVEDDSDEDERPRKSFFQHVRWWFNALIVVAALGAYPAMTVVDSDVGDRNVGADLDRTRWTAPWAGGAATVLEKHFNELGWAKDAPAWSPMARLTAKPAYQAAMAGSVGEFIVLSNSQAVAAGREDADLSAAARLVSVSSTGDQLRAARDALINYDRRLRRRAASISETPAQLTAKIELIDSWAVKSQADIARSAALASGPIDMSATTSVYSAKGRAMAAYIFLDTLRWPENDKAAAARQAALEAWKAAAEFHPLIVLNGSPDGSLFGNHAASMGFLIGQAQDATRAYLELVRSPAMAPANIANAAPVAALK
ncbi:MAG: hypothetical protein Q8R02_22510 [Hyphomonadaceae bacterium]|nr:hypothetical protein [Hyphomonadaceae bacterium]